MDPHEVFVKDRKKFDEDLAGLIDSAATAAAAALSSGSSSGTTPSTAPTSPIPADPRLRNRKRPVVEQPSAKRIKLEHQEESEITGTSPPPGILHPSRIALLDNVQRADAALDSPKSPPSETKPSAVGTGSNNVKLGTQSRRGSEGKTWNTLRNTVRRQWDTRKDDLDYDELLEHRRKEKLNHVDRYVPSTATSSPRDSVMLPPPRRKAPFQFADLPEKVQKMILSLLLVQEDPILIDFTWLRPFVKGHCRVPSASKSIQDKNGVYSLPLNWNELRADVALMQKDCASFKDALEVRGDKTRKLKSPCRSLTTSVLRVSRVMHGLSVPIFYGDNTWSFPWPSSAWMQLESFLATIGPANVAYLRKIDIHSPLWHRGIHEDFIEGAVLDLTSPASRMGVVKPAARDRLLGAIRSSVHTLLNAGRLESVTFTLEHGMETDRWIGRHRNDKQLLSILDAEEHIVRKQEGIKLLGTMSKFLVSPPVLSLHHPSPTSKISKYDVSEFRSRLAGVIQEAEKYGWTVNQHLNGRRW